MENTQESISNLRKDYTKAELNETELLKSPFEQFELWLTHAIETQQPEPNAMFLATVNSEGSPSGRIVLLRSFAEGVFCFFTNYESRKALQMDDNAKVSASFFWAGLERQIRIEGTVSKVTAAQSDAYFQSRPRGSQVGAWASPQSNEIPDRGYLQQSVEEVEAKFVDDAPIPRPSFWGGYQISPTYFEFWQGRASRLHDRLVYKKDGDNWQITRLAP